MQTHSEARESQPCRLPEHQTQNCSRLDLWVGAKDGLWRWKTGPPKFYSLPDEPNGIQGLAEDADGGLLVSMQGGIRRFVMEERRQLIRSRVLGRDPGS
jgi:ligand-binding sensor domain-containing protein